MRRLARPGIAVIGELNVDVVASGVVSWPTLGSEILADDLRLTLGSASAIFATGAAKLGHPITFVSQVGEDEFGSFCLRELKAAGISTRHVARTNEWKTGVTLSLSKGSERALVTYAGAIAKFNYAQLPLNLLKGHQHLHMTSYFLQKDLKPSFPKVFQAAKEIGLTTSFDPNSDPSDSWKKSINAVLRLTDILFVNESEALKLTRANNLNESLQHLGKQVPCAVIKRGARGAVAIHEGEVASAPSFKVNVVDTTGAGDSFAAGFVSAFLEGASVLDCLRNGNACGALSTLQPGGSSAQPDRASLKKFLRLNS